MATRDTLRALGLMIFNPAPAPRHRGECPRRAIPLNADQPGVADQRERALRHGYRALLLVHSDAAGAGRHQHRLDWSCAARGPRPPRRPRRSPIRANERNLTRFNPIPALRANKAIPLLVTVPNANAARSVKPANGWPVVIFQHGITRDRSDALRAAPAHCAAPAGWSRRSTCRCMASPTTTSPLYQATNEQTFNLDLVVNASGASGPDSVIDPTGTHFINLTYPLASRDNLRQGVVNLLALTRALPTLDLDGDTGTVDIDPDAHRLRRACRWARSPASPIGSVLPSPALVRAHDVLGPRRRRRRAAARFADVRPAHQRRPRARRA